MKVLKPGRTKIDWVIRTICPHCRAELEIEKKDCSIEKYDRQGVRYFECLCVECNGKIIVSGEMVKKTIDNLMARDYQR